MTVPAQLTVVLNLDRYPADDIPYLIPVKWALCDHAEWPALRENRMSLTLTDRDARHLNYDDLKRSIQWRARSSGLGLTWDDSALRLSVTWTPGTLPVAARPVLAKLAATVDTVADPRRRAQLITGEPEAVAGFGQLLDAHRQARPTSPAYRVDFNKLILPGPDSPTARDRAAGKSYEDFKRGCAEYTEQIGTEADPRVRFDDGARTVEFADWLAVVNSGQTSQLETLAEYAPTGPRPVHPAGPREDVRTFGTALEGSIHRAIEDAFATADSRESRQLDRRSLAPGLTVAVIAKIYGDYDQALPQPVLADIYATLDEANPQGNHDAALEKLIEHGGVVIGERHDRPDAYLLLNEQLAKMRSLGVTHVCTEAFHANAHQAHIDEFLRSGAWHPALQRAVKAMDARRGSPVFETLLKTARHNDMRIVGAEHLAAWMQTGIGRIGVTARANPYDIEKRVSYFNWAANRVVERLRLPPGSRLAVVTGMGHVNPSDFGYPGIAQLLRLPAVQVARQEHSNALRMVPLKEIPGRRLRAGLFLSATAVLTVLRRQFDLGRDPFSTAEHRSSTKTRPIPPPAKVTPSWNLS